MDFIDYPNRTGCDVLEEMRKCYGTYNFASLASLIEEMQSIANRMEAGLQDKHDARNYRVERSDLLREIKTLRAKKQKLEKKVKLLEEK